MKKRILSVLFALVLALSLCLVMAAPVAADSPITEKVTGGAHFASDAGNTVGHVVYLSMVGMQKSGTWFGQGSYRDPDIGLEAHLNFNDGFVVDTGYICFEGTAEVYINNVYKETMSLRVCVTDEDSDSVVDRIGVVIGGTSYHYSHMGYSVRDYAGRIKIH